MIFHMNLSQSQDSLCKGFVLPGRQERAPEGFMTPKSEVSEAPPQAAVKIHNRPGQHVVTPANPRSPTDIHLEDLGSIFLIDSLKDFVEWAPFWPSLPCGESAEGVARFTYI